MPSPLLLHPWRPKRAPRLIHGQSCLWITLLRPGECYKTRRAGFALDISNLFAKHILTGAEQKKRTTRIFGMRGATALSLSFFHPQTGHGRPCRRSRMGSLAPFTRPHIHRGEYPGLLPVRVAKQAGVFHPVGMWAVRETFALGRVLLVLYSAN